jgi:gamma-glutamyl:cysteine ligase YbdK (ATP-grasp superfamily)
MGRDVAPIAVSREDRRRYREKVLRCLDALAYMLKEAQFDFEHPHIGLEIELNLVDDRGDPAMRNAALLDALADPAWATELGQFNLEINVPPRELGGGSTGDLEREVRADLDHAARRGREVGARLVMIGILPTLRQSDIGADSLSANPRYSLLNEQIFAARGEDMHISIEGLERLSTYSDTIMPESACTSAQFHLQVSPQDYAPNWNAAQCIAGVQLALGANSPFLFGKELWRETRVALFEQATDTRPQELKEQGVRPRVWFGERWITSIFDQFEENVRYFPALLPVCEDEDPAAVLARGDTPRLGELRMHNGTIYRWNRPIYDVFRGKPHLRVENRVLPAGPTVVDVLANGAFYYGVLRMLVNHDRPLWSQMSFSAATDNFEAGARKGIDAQLYWPGLGEVPATELVLRRLLPLAHEGLSELGVDPAGRDRLLGIIERRCTTHQNGAEWQARTFHRIDEQKQPLDRRDSLREMLRRYVELMHSNEPVHTWPVD